MFCGVRFDNIQVRAKTMIGAPGLVGWLTRDGEGEVHAWIFSADQIDNQLNIPRVTGTCVTNK
jgi:Iap family predicted aminopeptidase